MQPRPSHADGISLPAGLLVAYPGVSLEEVERRTVSYYVRRHQFRLCSWLCEERRAEGDHLLPDACLRLESISRRSFLLREADLSVSVEVSKKEIG